MRKLLLFTLLLVCITGVALSQGEALKVINECNNFYLLRQALQNAECVGSAGIHAFITTATADSITGVTGLTANSIIIALPRPAVLGGGSVLALPVAGDLMNAAPGGNGTAANCGVSTTIYINRAVNTTSGLSYQWYLAKW